MGIRKKISLGFIFLALMLAFSGMVSVVELVRMSRYTGALLEKASEKMAISKRMLDAAQKENTAMLQMIVLEDDIYKRRFDEARGEFASIMREAERVIGDEGYMTIRGEWDKYNKLLNDFFDSDIQTDIEWFLNMYETTYHNLTSSIKEQMVGSQRELAGESWQLTEKAYRAITPGIITLCVGILMVLLFAYLLDLYYTRPLLGISRGLRGYIDNKAPFNVKMEGRDEIRALKDSVEEIITICKNKTTDR